MNYLTSIIVRLLLPLLIMRCGAGPASNEYTSTSQKRNGKLEKLKVKMHSEPIQVSEKSGTKNISLQSTLSGYQVGLSLVWVHNDMKLVIDDYDKRYDLEDEGKTLVLVAPITYKDHDGMYKIVAYNDKRDVASASTQVIVEKVDTPFDIKKFKFTKVMTTLSKYPPFITTGVVIFAANMAFLFLCCCVQPSAGKNRGEAQTPHTVNQRPEQPDERAQSELQMEKPRDSRIDDYMNYDESLSYDDHYGNSSYNDYHNTGYDQYESSDAYGDYTQQSAAYQQPAMEYESQAEYQQQLEYGPDASDYAYEPREYDHSQVNYDHIPTGYDQTASEYAHLENEYDEAQNYQYEQYEDYYDQNYMMQHQEQQ